MAPRIAIDQRRIGEFCKRHHVRRLALFGSVLREDFGPDSDVDVLVEFEPGHVPGFAFFDLREELAAILGRRVDLHTPASLSRYFRDRVVREAEDPYVPAGRRPETRSFLGADGGWQEQPASLRAIPGSSGDFPRLQGEVVTPRHSYASRRSRTAGWSRSSWSPTSMASRRGCRATGPPISSCPSPEPPVT